MRNSILIVGWVVACVGCEARSVPDPAAPPPPKSAQAGSHSSDEPIPREVERALKEVAGRQSQGLKRAQTVVHRAFEHGDRSFYGPDDSQKVVAVDVEFRGYAEGFDLDDVDILDGETNENFGSGPDIKFLNPDGTLNPDEPVADDTGPLHVLLVYVVPKSVKSIKLEYWGERVASRPVPLTAGGLRYDESRLIAGVQFQPYPRSMHFRDVWRRGRWLLANLVDGAAVVDLRVRPPTIDYWDCNMLRGVEAAPQGGWIMLTRTGKGRDDIRFPIWHHPADKPGASPLAAPVHGPVDHLDGVGVLGGKVFAYDGKFLYWLVDGRLQRDDALGENRLYTRGTVVLAGGRTLLIWNGDGYELVDGRLKKTWPLAIDEPYDFMTVPWGTDGFYFLEKRRAYRVRPSVAREQVLSALENVMNIEPGPEGSILFKLGSNRSGTVVGLWFPSDDTYIPLGTREISATADSVELDNFLYSDATRYFYVVARDGIFTIPADQVLARPRVKLTPLPPK